MVLTMGVGLQQVSDYWNLHRHQSSQCGPVDLEGVVGPFREDEYGTAAGRIWWASHEITAEWK